MTDINNSHCNTLQHTATHCNTLQHTAEKLIDRPHQFLFPCLPAARPRSQSMPCPHDIPHSHHPPHPHHSRFLFLSLTHILSFSTLFHVSGDRVSPPHTCNHVIFSSSFFVSLSRTNTHIHIGCMLGLVLSMTLRSASLTVSLLVCL